MSELKKKLSGQINRDDLVCFLNENKLNFEEAIELALGDDEKLSWRAAWVINHVMKQNDQRLIFFAKDIIESIKNKRDGHQRELLKVVEKMKIDEDIEGYLFDVCMTIWEDVNKIPSVRIKAFSIIYDLIKKYPELANEIEFITQKHYYETLSPGIKSSFLRMKKQL